jgi:hypothetical protein
MLTHKLRSQPTLMTTRQKQVPFQPPPIGGISETRSPSPAFRMRLIRLSESASGTSSD